MRNVEEQPGEPAASVPDPSPRSFPGWLICLWSDVLFPGRRGGARGVSWRAVVSFVFLRVLFLSPCLSSHLFEPDEGRSAEPPRERLARGEWIVPRGTPPFRTTATV